MRRHGVKARGGDLAFTNAADFNRMVENAHWKIGDIVQKARFRAEESGVEARGGDSRNDTRRDSGNRKRAVSRVRRG